MLTKHIGTFDISYPAYFQRDIYVNREEFRTLFIYTITIFLDIFRINYKWKYYLITTIFTLFLQIELTKLHKMTTFISLALAAHGPPSILEPLAPSFRTTTTTTTTTTTMPSTSVSSGGITLSHVTVMTDLLYNITAVVLLSNDSITANLTNITQILESSRPMYSLSSMIFMGVIAGILSLLTVVGNVMVMISFKIDKQLQTISNYFLFSLAIADFAIGLISMPLFAVSKIVGYWPLGPHICDTWLALDYLASNASVLNLLIISFDRYFSVTRPLTYRAKRTTNRAACMISAAWGISLILWPPWIYSWPYIEGKRTVPQEDCYIQFIETNQYITFLTALAAFYFPVTIMCFLYYRIWKETKKRQKDLPNLQAGKKDSSKRSISRLVIIDFIFISRLSTKL